MRRPPLERSDMGALHMAGRITLSSVCRPSDEVVFREIEGDTVIIPLTAGIGDAEDELYSLNETGRAIWHKLDGERTLGEVAAALALEFEASSDELQADVVGFVAEMTRRGILTARD